MRTVGRFRDGSPVEILTLGSEDELQADVLTLGGTLVSLTMPVEGRRIPLVLALPDLATCLRDRNYMGQLIGRYANRIANGSFAIGSRRFQLALNDGKHTLHGGKAPFGKEQWRIVSAQEGERGFVRLAHLSRDGAGGFPGNLEVTASVSVAGNSIRLDFEAQSDAPTPISFTWHPYFNLSGHADAPIGKHRLRLAATSYLPVDSTWIPIGEIAPVAGTRFDFRSFKEIGSADMRDDCAQPLNQCFVVDANSPIVAQLQCPESGIQMELRSDRPGIQVYDGYFLRDQYPRSHGVALEPGFFPDSPNQPSFPDCILKPGDVHRSFMSYSFRTGAFSDLDS